MTKTPSTKLPPISPKPLIATLSLAGCFGCHMSLLDIDLKLLELIQKVTLYRSPLTDIKSFGQDCDIGLVEGGCCNSENVHQLKEFRKHCKILISVGECAIMGGLPAMRNNQVSLQECLEEVYLRLPSNFSEDQQIPQDPELPKILDKVYPCHQIVKMDYFLPGCPPRAGLIWKVLEALIEGKACEIPYDLIKYD